MFTVQCGTQSRKFYRSLSIKDRRIVLTHIERLRSYPDIAADLECLHKMRHYQEWRMHIGRSYTVLYSVHLDKSEVHIDHIMTIEQAHKRYGRI